MKHILLAAALALAATPALAGICDEPPFGMKYPEVYKTLTDLAGPELLRNICRAKFMHDTKMRKHLHQIGFSDELIDGHDVGYVAVKVIEAIKECIDAHHGDASRC